jgi:hypothetical protein
MRYTAKPGSIPALLVALALGHRVQLYHSLPILDEYRDVLHRPKFGFERRRCFTRVDRGEKRSEGRALISHGIHTGETPPAFSLRYNCLPRGTVVPGPCAPRIDTACGQQ